jgi:hypothetical protein
MKVLGHHLERADSLVRQLEEMECDEHSDLADVHLIIAQDGSVQGQPNVVCCEQFRAAVRNAIDAHNAQRRG